MSTSLDLILVPVAVSLIDRLGSSVTWTQVLNPNLAADFIGGVEQASPTDVVITASPPAPIDSSMAGNTIMVNSATVIYAYPSQFIDPTDSTVFAPKTGAKVTLGDGSVYSVTAVRPFYSGDDIAVYEIEVRR